MFNVIEKDTGKRRTVYAVNGDNFIIGTEDGFVTRHVSQFIPAAQKAQASSCKFIKARSEAADLDELLTKITSGEIPVERGDMIYTKLLDGTEVDLVVTDQDDKTIRLESRDCLGIRTSARELDAFLDKVYALLPNALKSRIIETERVHFVDGDEDDRVTKRCKLFVPAASEIFPPDECYGDEGLYEQLEWYKDVHNRVRADRRGGDSHWYWTGSAYGASSFCFVSGNGDAYNSGASAAYGVSPFGCIISKI